MFKKIGFIILFICLSSISLGVLIPTDSYDYKNRFNINNVANFSASNISANTLCINGDCKSVWDASNPFNQELNTTSNVTFNSINSSHVYIPRGAGLVTTPNMTSNGSGGVNISSSVAYCYNGGGRNGALHKVTIPAQNNVALTDDWKTSATFIYVDCLNLNYLVSYAIEYDFIVSNGRYIPFGEIIRDGNNLHIAPVVIYADSGELEAQKSCNLKEYSITENSYKTLTVALTSDYNVSHTAVDTFHCQFFDTMPQTTTSERLYQIARNTSTDWQKTSATNPKINYTHFDNGTGWQLYGANKIARCIYHGGVEVAASGHTYIRCVGQYDTLSEAEADTSIPDMPVLMSEHTEFLATIIFNVSNASQQLILYDKSKLSTASASNDYNNLVNRPDLTVYALISNLVSYVGNWSLDKPNYYTSSEVDILDGFKLDINDQRYNDSAGFNNLNWSKINSSTFPVACPAGTAVTQINNSITCTSFNQGYQSSAAGWVNNTGNISTSLNVNMTGNLTVNRINITGSGFALNLISGSVYTDTGSISTSLNAGAYMQSYTMYITTIRGSGNTGFTINPWKYSSSTDAVNDKGLWITPTSYFSTKTGGNQSFVTIEALYNQTTGNANNTDLWINRPNETKIGNGSQYLMRATYNNTDKFRIATNGTIEINGTLYINGVAVSTGPSGGSVNGTVINISSLYFGNNPSQCDATTGKTIYNVTTGLFQCNTDQTAAGGGYQTIQNEGTPLTQQNTLNFVGSGVNCADDTTRTTCTISGGSASVPGTDSEIAYRNLTDGSIAGATNARINNGYLFLPNTTEPTQVGLNGVTLFSETRGQESLLAYLGNAGYDKYSQPHMAYENVWEYLPAESGTATTAPTAWGFTAVTPLGTVGVGTVDGTSFRNSISRITLTSTSNISELKPGVARHFRGNNTRPYNNGGFKLVMRYDIQFATNITAGCYGMVGTTTAYTVTSNCMNGALAANGALFTGFNNSEITLGYYGSNGTGPQRLFDCGVNFPIGNNTNSSLAIYETTIFAKPNGGNVSFFTKRLDNSSIAPCVFTLDSEVNKTRLPLYNTNLAFRMTTLKNNATGSNNNIVMGFNKLYLSKDN